METKILKRKYLVYGMITAIVLGGAGIVGCKKKSRLSSNTSNFSIVPPAATLLVSSTQTLTLSLTAKQTSPGGGNIDVNPDWSISGAGTCLNCNTPNLTPSFGPTVLFTNPPPQQLGEVTIKATYNGMTATSKIELVNFIPPTTPTRNIFDIYTDQGLPTSVPGQVDSNIFVFGSAFTLQELSGEYTPEGNKFQRTTGMNGVAGWGVTLDYHANGYSIDLSSFSSGNLIFSIKLSSGSGNISVEVKSKTGAGSVPLSAVSTDWTEISIPLSNFPVDFSKIVVPWDVSITNASNLSFDIDAIRWQK